MTRLLVVLHRWIGVVLCLLFAAWFASGVIMLYVPFPSLSTADRLDRAQPVDLAKLSDPFAAILANADVSSLDRARIIALDGRPALVAEGADNRIAVVSAESGELLSRLTMSAAETIARQFSGSEVERVDGPFDYDQWIVHQQFDRFRPFFRVALADGAATHLYVSAITGEVLQRTRGRERVWNYFGAVVHWIYPTLIRKNWVLWDQLVWWLSLVSIVGALLGVTLGVIRTREAWLKGRRGIASPYAGWMRWHHQAGMIVGVFVLTWIFSGWLSMDHGRLFSIPDPGAQQLDRFRGISLPEAVSRVSSEQLRAFSGAAEIEISAIAGEPVIVVRDASGTHSNLVSVSESAQASISLMHIERAVAAAWPASSILQSYAVPLDDRYTNLREGTLGEGAVRVVLDDDSNTWVHVDSVSGRIVSVMDRSRRVYRWLFNGLHSFDFPGFVDRRPLWDLTMIFLLISGFAFSITGTVIGYRRLRRNIP